MLKNLLKQKTIFLRYMLIIFFVLSFLMLILAFYIQFKLDDVVKSELIDKETQIVNTANTIVSNRLSRISGDLLYVADCIKLSENDNGDFTDINKLLVAFSDRKKIYDQIRYIDAAGDEVIRVDYYKNGSFVVDKSKLQNKSTRYYFEDSIKLAENQIYFSKLDLNVENNAIEEPIKPTLRISTPLFINGELKGIIVLNYLADDILNQLEQVDATSSGSMFMLNSDGYWLFNSENKDSEWSFMYEDKADISFLSSYSKEWELISNKTDGYLISENGLFVYSKIVAGKEFVDNNDAYSYSLGSGDWTLISFMSIDSQNGAIVGQNTGAILLLVIKTNSVYLIIIFIVSASIAALLSLNKNEREQIKYFSEYDIMTGVYNRRAGFERLSTLFKSATKSNCTISVCFIDINGLKEVNDALGHDSGDELILSVIAGIKQHIRQNDFVSRLGGDEFLVIFEGLGESQAQEIWERILNYYNFINETENRRYIVSASHGIETFNCNSEQYIEAIVNRADEKMYSEKRQIKQNLKVLRDI